MKDISPVSGGGGAKQNRSRRFCKNPTKVFQDYAPPGKMVLVFLQEVVRCLLNMQEVFKKTVPRSTLSRWASDSCKDPYQIRIQILQDMRLKSRYLFEIETCNFFNGYRWNMFFLHDQLFVHFSRTAVLLLRVLHNDWKPFKNYF